MRYIIIGLLMHVWVFAEAQIHTYIVMNTPLGYTCGVFRSGENMLVTFGGNGCEDFSTALIDTNGNITALNHYGSGQAMEFPYMARQQDNGEILMCGWNFWDSTANTNIGNYKGYVMVIDTFGQFKRAFHVKGNTTYFNKVRNGIRLGDFYFFTGSHTDSSEINPPISRPFLCKTDTLGNLLWFKTYPQFDFTVSQTNMGLEYSHNYNDILVGTNLIDSLVNNTYYYTSYFLMRLDTAGNFLNRVPLPMFSGNEQFSGINPVMQIKRITGQRYMLACNREWYLLDQAYNILDSLNLALKPDYAAYYTHLGLYNESFLIGSGLGFGLEYNSSEVFSRDYSSIPYLGSFVDVIPTYDGGYFGVTNKNSTSRYIKMDCDGNYLNPKICYPLGVPELGVDETAWTFAGGELRINHLGGQRHYLEVYDVSGRLLLKQPVPYGYTSTRLTGYTPGIYLLRLRSRGQISKTMKVWLD